MLYICGNKTMSLIFVCSKKMFIYVAEAFDEHNGRIRATEKKGSNGLLNFR